MNTAPYASKPVRRIVIAGGGTAGWMVAAGLSKSLGRLYDIRLIESEEIGTIGVGEATIPTLHFFHEILGLDEREFMAATQATFKLGISFENWRNVGEHYFHSFGSTGKPHWTAGFQHFWLEGRKRGLASDYGDYCLELRAAMDNRFAHLPNTGLNYAYHLDATLYAQYLRRYAEALGVQRIEGKIVRVHSETSQAASNGGITGLSLNDGSLIEGDLFIDCTGMRSLLLGETLGVAYQDWSEWLHCDSAVAAQTASVSEAVPYTRSIAHPWGWQWRIPLQHRVGNGLVFSSRHLDDESAKAALLANVQGKVIRQPRVIKFTPGQRELVWKRNCVAIGLSSGFLEPLESTSIHLIQRGLTRLIQMFPAEGICQSDIDEYNDQSRRAIETIRDFIILHYHVNQRSDAKLWRDCREMAVPNLLAHRIQLFKDTARVCLDSDELFRDNSWIQVMLGQGIAPAAHHPVTRQMSDADLSDFLGEIRKDAARNLIKLPKHQDYVGRFCGAPKPAAAGPVSSPPSLQLNPQPQIQTLQLTNGQAVFVIDDFVQDPDGLVRLAQSVSNQFQRPAGHPYPGPQLDLPAAMAGQLDDYFRSHLRTRLQAGPPQGMYGRFSRVTQDASTLDARQRTCHRDDSGLEPGQMMCALVHYLFADEQLGGTVLFRSLMSEPETENFLADAKAMNGQEFGEKYGLPAGYMTQSNRYFEVIGRVPAKWNRAVFYDGSIFHSGDIQAAPAAYQAGLGRLTVNAFFKSTKLAA
ncbi:DUF6445 family protein [Roseateles sp.]|uniref:DUF6445 family protein n=1 Tax=Roseateles sp. TaxID=1971397 RepID=UPI00286BF6B6|nr:DUF6445 family protein [Roseateles sp.]